jgi:hypothetical protein
MELLTGIEFFLLRNILFIPHGRAKINTDRNMQEIKEPFAARS